MTELEKIQDEYNEISKEGKCIADRYHQRKIKYNEAFDAIFSKIWEIEPREKDAQNPFASTKEITAKAIQMAEFESDEEIITAFHQHEEDYYEFAELDSKGLELGFIIAALTAFKKTETPQNPNEWRFYPMHIIAPQEIIDKVINPILEEDARVGKGLYLNATEIETEDEDEDGLLMIDAYNCKTSFVRYCEDLKRFGVIGSEDAFFSRDLKLLLLTALNNLGTYISKHTDRPAATKNHITAILKKFDIMPIYGLFFQILILQGLIKWLEGVNLNEGDNGYDEACELYTWIQIGLAKKMTRLCFMPFEDDDKAKMKPFTDYLMTTETGQWVQREMFGSEDNARKDAPTETEKRLPKELDTPKFQKLLRKAVKIGLCDDSYKWLKSKSLLAYFANKASEYLGLSKGKYFNTDTDNDEDKTFWKPFETLFDKKKLSQSKRDYTRKGLPRGYEDVDNLFK